MEFAQLRYVSAVAETCNFTRAASQCHVVQSALSHQIKALERELGVELFARSSRRVEITAAGEAFLPYARAAVEAAEKARCAARATTAELQGTLAVGAIPTVTGVDLPAALGELRRAHPKVRVTLRVGNSNEFIGDIAAGSLDLAILGVATDVDPVANASGVSVREMLRERLVAVLPTGHRLAGADTISLAEISAETFVDFPAGGTGRQQSDLAFTAAGLCREVAFESMSTQILLDLVRRGLAVALLAPCVVEAEPDVVTVPVIDGPTRAIYVAWSSFNPSPATLALLKVLTR